VIGGRDDTRVDEFRLLCRGGKFLLNRRAGTDVLNEAIAEREEDVEFVLESGFEARDQFGSRR
jgi:hypothetical protein